MANLAQAFGGTGYQTGSEQPLDDFSDIPAGMYPAMITESEIKPTKSGSGQMLQLVFTVMDGQHKGRKLWERLNIINPNPQAVQISRRTIEAICRAVGFQGQLVDSTQIHNKPLYVRVAYDEREQEGRRNSIAAYKSASEQQPTPQPATHPTQAQAAASPQYQQQPAPSPHQQQAPVQQQGSQPAGVGTPPAPWGAQA